MDLLTLSDCGDWFYSISWNWSFCYVNDTIRYLPIWKNSPSNTSARR